MANQELVLESLRSQYREDLKVFINECQCFGKTYVDVGRLNEKLKGLQEFAFMDGLSEEDWLELIYDVAPDIYDNLDFGIIAA